MREKRPFGCGRERMVARVVRTEDSDEACEFAKKHIRKASAIHAAEHFSYDDPAGLSELNGVDQCKGIRD